MTAAIKLTDTCSLEYKLWQTFLQSFSHVWLFVSSWTAARQASLSFTITQSLLKLMSIESVMLSNHLILCCLLLLLSSVFPSTRVFSIESALCIRWPKYCSYSMSLSNECWGSHCSPRDSYESSLAPHSKASIILCWAFFMVQLTSVHDYCQNHSFD